jgi:hypothetical protein
MSLVLDGSNGVTFPNSTTQASAGSVIQVVNALYSTLTSNSTTTLADTGLTASITPKFATSKILVLVNHTENDKSNGNSQNDLWLRLLRNGSALSDFCTGMAYTSSAMYLHNSVSFNYLDSPATTSSVTYKTQFRNGDNNGASVTVQSNGSPSSITLMEIAQ